MIQLSPKYKALWNDTRFFVVTGGRGSSKSFGVGTFASLLSFEMGHKILFTRSTMSSAHLSIIPEFQQKLELLGAEHLFHVTRNEIINNQSGSEILFKGLKTSSGDQTASLKSLQGVTTWILDEAEELVNENTFDKINLSIRQKGVQNRVILILNPATKEHWIYTRFFQNAGVQEGFNGVKDNVTYIHTTYMDNMKHLDKSFLDEIERVKQFNPDKYRHQILGGWLDKAEGVVFTNWRFGDFNPDNLQTSFGQDFGFTIDPTTLIEVAIDKKKKIIYLKEHIYKTGLTTSQIAELNKQICGNRLIVADSAEPRLITELRSQGCNIIPTEKGIGSVSAGLALMKDYEIVLENNSQNMAKEFNNYIYSDSKSGLVVDAYNHAIDGARYNVFYQLANPQKGKYYVY